LLSLLTLQQNCRRAYRRYADTVAVLSAIYHILRQPPLIVDFIGIETKLKNSQGDDVVPDLAALYNSRSKGLLFELKWSLPFNEELLEKEVKELKKYIGKCSQWRNSNGVVDYQDCILVCHIEDAERLLVTVKRVAEEKGYDFLKSEGFAVWTWTISAARGGERREHLILSEVYGSIRNSTMESMIKRPTGLVLPEESLTYLRSTFSFTREKPPVQYTAITLVQHILSQFLNPERGKGVYKITTDMIYEKSQMLFPSWFEYDISTIQMKRRWLTLALEFLFALGLIGKPLGEQESWLVPIPTLKTRGPIEETLCKKFSKYQLKIKKRAPKGRMRVRPIRFKAPPEIKKISDYF